MAIFSAAFEAASRRDGPRGVCSGLCPWKWPLLPEPDPPPARLSPSSSFLRSVVAYHGENTLDHDQLLSPLESGEGVRIGATRMGFVVRPSSGTKSAYPSDTGGCETSDLCCCDTPELDPAPIP